MVENLKKVTPFGAWKFVCIDKCLFICPISYYSKTINGSVSFYNHNEMGFYRWFFAVLPFGYSDLLVVEWARISNKIWTEIAFVVVGTSFLAYMFNIYALKRLRSSTVGFYIYLQPVLATIIALILGSDKLDLIKVFASLIIFTGVYHVGRNPKTD